jgi:hypothetical protein
MSRRLVRAPSSFRCWPTSAGRIVCGEACQHHVRVRLPHVALKDGLQVDDWTCSTPANSGQPIPHATRAVTGSSRRPALLLSTLARVSTFARFHRDKHGRGRSSASAKIVMKRLL